MNPISSLPTCPPPIPPAPLTPPSFAMTGTGDVIVLPSFLDPDLEPAGDADEVVGLSVVPAIRSTAARAPFITLVLGLLGGGLVSLLLINTALSQGAFAVQSLQKSNLTLVEQQQQLKRDLADADQPGALAKKAVALGMVPGGAPAFLRLPDGKVMGTPKVAVPLPKPAPVVVVTPSVTPTVGAPVSGAATSPTPGGAATSAPATTPSVGQTTAPAGKTTAPAGHTTAPAGHTTAPAGHTTAPAGHTTAPAGHTTAPAGHTTAPAGHTTAPAGKTTPPAGKTTSPAGRITPTKGKP